MKTSFKCALMIVRKLTTSGHLLEAFTYVGKGAGEMKFA